MTADLPPVDGCLLCTNRDGKAMGWYKDKSTGEPILCDCRLHEEEDDGN